MYKYDLGHTLCVVVVTLCKVSCIARVQREREKVRESSLPRSYNRRVWRRRGQEVVASVYPRHCNLLSHIVYFAACGLSWFFPPLWVFHIISCVSTFHYVLCV